MNGDGDAARSAWARLLGLDRLERFLVIVAPDSYLCRPGWIGILRLDGTVTATVPTADARDVVAEALDGLSPEDVVRPEIVRPRLPATRSVRGPAPLFYPPRGYVVGEIGDARPVSRGDLEALITTVAPGDVDESGMLDVIGPLFGSRTPAGDLAAVSGYRQWPNDVAHLSVLTTPAHRGRGHGRQAAAAAIHHAIGKSLLPQWRARPPASQALARSLGLIEFGSQLSFEPA